jgi:hypothetical protein
LPDNDKDDSWLDEEPEKHNSVQALDAKTTSPIDPASKYLTTFLADNEDKSTISVGVEDKKENKLQFDLEAAAVRDDNDFSMKFD